MSVSTTSWQAPLRTVLGIMLLSRASSGSFLSFSSSVVGISGLTSFSTRSANSSRSWQPNARQTRS